jgi:hypothetical protein
MADLAKAEMIGDLQARRGHVQAKVARQLGVARNPVTAEAIAKREREFPDVQGSASSASAPRRSTGVAEQTCGRWRSRSSFAA